MTPPFPTVYVRGDEAGFYLDFKLVRVPLKFGSDDMSLHVIPWLFRYWPFVNKKNRLVKVMPDGEHRALDKEFADVKYRGIGYEFDRIETVDGNWLNWTGYNIRPKRDSNAPATENEKKNEVERRLWEINTVGRTLNGERVPSGIEFMTRTLRDLRRAVAATVHAYDSILTTDQSIGINTDISTTLAEWERNVVADFRVGDAERVEKEKKEDQLDDDEYERTIAAPNPFYENGADPKPATRTFVNVGLKADGTPITPVPDAIIRDIPVTLHDPATPYATVEQVLNHFGWVTPENGHKPVFEGLANPVIGRVRAAPQLGISR